MFAWLPAILIDTAGVDAATAGSLLALFSFMGLPVALVVPLLVARLRRTTPFYALAVATGLAGVAGLLFAPGTATALWVVLIGLPPLMFPMVLVLFGLRTRSHETAVALSGFVQSLGYALAALAPLTIGVAHEITGGWTAGLLVLGGAVVIVVPAAIVVARSETIEEAWERRHGRAW
jgi:CP family cyanate transporter-like MFS transporter